MKKVTLSMIAALSMSTFAVAGGDIAPVEPEVTVPEVVESTPGSFYVGLGYSYMNLNLDSYSFITAPGGPVANVPEEDFDGDAVLLLAGYNFNQYFGVEARYAGFTDCLENYGIYAKPMYPIGNLTVYGLLGYGETTYTFTNPFSLTPGSELEESQSGFQWGFGASYALTEQIDVFVDYTNLYDGDADLFIPDMKVDAISVGMTYKF